MSRMTAAQVIGQGDYLEPGFEASSLTVSQLLGVLGYHNIVYPTPYSKGKLVQLFKDQIQTRSAKLKKERLKKENSIASDEGIKDGVTGKLLGGTRTTAAGSNRRVSRRLSHAPVDAEELLSSRPEAPKRRRSSALHNQWETSRNGAPSQAQATVFEDSEPEDEELPKKKIGKSKKVSDVAYSQRRVSQPDDDSGWEDKNIFQSGAESSSPARPSPVRPRSARTSIGPRKSRKSSSVPLQPLVASPSSYTDNNLMRKSPFSSPFEPVLPSITASDALIKEQDSMNEVQDVRSIKPDITNNEPVDEQVSRTESKEDVPNQTEDVLEIEKQIHNLQDTYVDSDSMNEAEAHNLVVSRRLGGDVASYAPRTVHTSIIARLFFLTTMFLLGTSVMKYKTESASIGYCDTGSNTNKALDDLRERRLLVESCNREIGTTLHDVSSNTVKDQKDCPLPPLIPWPRADACTPCPEHASCSQFGVTCDTGYLMKPHQLFFYFPAVPSARNITASLAIRPIDGVWKIISMATDGLPGFGSIAFPPRCMEDPKRKQHINVIGKAVETLLGKERGRRLCSGDTLHRSIKESDGGEAKMWGTEIESLRKLMMKKTPPNRVSAFDDTFNEAVQQLVQWGGVIFGEDEAGQRYLAHKTPTLTWDCAVIVKTRIIWEEWRITVLGMLITLTGLLATRYRMARKHVESRRVAGLVQIALDTLRNVEIAHHADPVTSPQPYLSSLQLRDLILQDEHSISARRRVWDRVERVVEENANVRANLEEIEGGDEMRVWRWVGNAGYRTKAVE